MSYRFSKREDGTKTNPSSGSLLLLFLQTRSILLQQVPHGMSPYDFKKRYGSVLRMPFHSEYIS
jgi:hypothetical protein